MYTNFLGLTLGGSGDSLPSYLKIFSHINKAYCFNDDLLEISLGINQRQVFNFYFGCSPEGPWFLLIIYLSRFPTLIFPLKRYIPCFQVVDSKNKNKINFLILVLQSRFTKKRKNLKYTTEGQEPASIVHYTRPGSSIKQPTQN